MDFATYDNLNILKNNLLKAISDCQRNAIEHSDDNTSRLLEDVHNTTIPKGTPIKNGTAGTKEDTVGNVIEIPWFDVNEYGIITAYGTRRHTISSGGDDM